MVSAPPLIYCHGLPGSREELSVFAPKDVAASAIALRRLNNARHSYRDATLMAFDEAVAGVQGRCVVFGFSLGAMAALLVSSARPEKIDRVILASPAAPLELGDFLPSMAGRAVFEAAIGGDFRLRTLSGAQSILLKANWNFLRSAMFHGASPVERELVRDPRVDAAIRSALQGCLGRSQEAYRRELIAYVQPWAAQVRGVACPIEIWQGTADTWTPPTMASALCALLGQAATLKLCEGLGHYSTLGAALHAVKPPASP